MKQLKQKDVKQIREELLKKNDGICPILKIPLDPSDAALDHAHQDSEISETVEGQIRSTIHKYANSLEGTMRSRFRRSGVASYIAFEEFLLNLYEYLMEYREPLLHPSHAAKPRKLMKSSYNELCKEIKKLNSFLKKQIKCPDYPKSKRLTKKLAELYDLVKIYPRYYNK
jgi:hypothetical protein